MPAGLHRLLLRLNGRQDLMLVVLMITIIGMMILPLPTMLIDLMLATNMALTVLLLMVGIYLLDPVEFSTLPAVILIGTVFRLSLAVSTTRLILLQADAGKIISTFGEFVIAGNLIIGLVVFLIITVVQFVVITKGAERIAEVSARFTLDALPGKQMSIDSDLRNGDIDQREARRRRQRLEKESQLYGAMDGAMKFVKGDAIAGLVIIAVNLIGGIAVGTLQHGMPLSEALHVYSLLTVGDGLVTQIPALFMSITAGTIVTRVTTDDAQNLGADIAGQLVANPRSLRLAALVLCGLAFVPGFPMAIFLGLAALFGLTGIALHFRDRDRATASAAAAAHSAEVAALAPASDGAVLLRLGPGLDQLQGPSLASGLSQLRESLHHELGMPCPTLNPQAALDLAPGAFVLELEDVPMAEGTIKLDRLLLQDEPDHLRLAEVPSEPGGPFLNQPSTLWLELRHAAALDEAGIGYLTPLQCLLRAVRHHLKLYAAHFVGVQETQAMLARMEATHRDLVREVLKIVPLQKIAEVFRRLLDEGVPIRNGRLVLEALIEWGSREQDVVLLTEFVRGALKRQICHAYADQQKVLHAYLLEQDIDQALRDAIRQTSVGGYLALADDQAERIIAALHRRNEQLASDRITPVIIASLDVRRFLRSLLIKNQIRIPVLSFQELAPEFTVQPVATLRLDGAAPRARAASPLSRLANPAEAVG